MLSTTMMSYDYYDNLINKALFDGTAERVGNSEIFAVKNNNDGDDDDTIRIGHILSLLPQTEHGIPYDLNNDVTVFLAVQDWNNRNFSMVVSNYQPQQQQDTTNSSTTTTESSSSSSSFYYPSLDELTKGCNFYMSPTFRDSGRDFFILGKAWQDAFFGGGVGTTNNGHNRSVITQQQQQQQRPFAVVGAWSSHISAKLATLAAVTTTGDSGSGSGDSRTTNEGFINISPASAASYLEDRMQYPWLARTQLTPGNFGAAFVTYYLNSINVRQVAILYPETGFGRSVLQSMVHEATQYHLHVFSVSYVDGNIDSMKQAINLLKTKTEFVYFYGVGPGREIVLELYDANMLGPDTRKEWLFMGSSIGKLLGEQRGNTQQRLGEVHIALNRSSFVSIQWYRESQQPIIDRHLEALTNRKKQFLQDPDLIAYFQRRIRSGSFGGDDANSTIRYYELLNNTQKKAGMVDLNCYDAVMSLGLASCRLQTTTADDYRTPFLYESLKSVKFFGSSHNVAFNETSCSRSIDSLGAQIQNLLTGPSDSNYLNHSTLSARTARVYWKENGSFVLGSNKSPLLYLDGTTVPPPSIPSVEEDMNLVPIGIRGVCWALAGLVLVLSALCALWTLRYRHQTEVRASQPIYLLLLCMGTFLLGCSIIPFTWQEPMPKHILDVGCMLHVWLLSIGFSTTFTALIAKTWRIRRVVGSARQFRRAAVVASDVFWVPAAVFGFNIALLVSWTVHSPLHWERTVLETDIFDRPTSSTGTCYASGNASVVFGLMIVSVNLLAFFLAGYQCYKSRLLPSVFNESFYMTVTICIIVEAILIGLPIMVVVKVNNIAFMLVGSWIISIAALAALFPMFWPKVMGHNESVNTMNLSSRTLWRDRATQFAAVSNLRQSCPAFNT